MSISKKIVLVGHFGVGKSSLIRRFVQNAFSEDYIVTIGVQIHKKEIVVNNTNLTFIIWDVEGKDDLEKIRQSYLLGTSGFIYVIDPTRDSTYINLEREIDFIHQNFPTSSVVKVASKADLIDEEVFIKELSANNLAVDFLSSAKTGKNVQEIFEKLGLNLI
ncbi:GTP-binding protein [Flavobacterium faecale]|uniref:GTP-binding protein n=1 Tax=Flavobacterium faecale TaxID=1355330 RepID=A0A2S1LC37_9FLAO|nr:Rab family GTPase [Flavobacterium faecale]AWG21116.1 GTP-binding protein [Flavobacterium faecale]